jgi:cytidylate kinase
MTNTINVITIDGPSGTGKGTLSLMLADKLGWHYLDSGVLYRVLAYLAIQQNIAFDDEAQLAQIAAKMPIQFILNKSNQSYSVVLDNNDITKLIRSEEVSTASSQVSAHPSVRNTLIELQKSFRQAPGLITDGRDMGTVIFPTAQLKVFMTACPEIRAQRRYNQLKEKGIDVNLVAVESELNERDKRDQERSVAPLKPADDACIVDTSNKSTDEVLQEIMELVQARSLISE